MRLFKHLNYDFMAKRNIFYIVSLALFIFGVINILFRGLEFGIDFRGGSEIVLQFDNAIKIEQVRDNVNKIGLGTVEVKTFGGSTGVLIRTELQQIPTELFPRVASEVQEFLKEKLGEQSATQTTSTGGSVTYKFATADAANNAVQALNDAGFQAGRVAFEADNTEVLVRVGISDWIKINLRDKITNNNFDILREDRVGPKVGDELRRDAMLAVILSLVGILIYLGFRFKFLFAIGAVVALFHDALITLGFYAILYGVIPGLNLEIDLTVVAAFLTLIGYSINDTVVVFDRIREVIKIHKGEKLEKLMNESISATMSRTVLTGGTTLLTVVILLIFGGEVLRAFSFTLFFGIIIGTYSSIFVAAALVLDWAIMFKNKVEF